MWWGILLWILAWIAQVEAGGAFKCIGVASTISAPHNPNLSFGSACLYHISCEHKYPRPLGDNLRTGPATKTLLLSLASEATQMILTYTYDSSTTVCSYTIASVQYPYSGFSQAGEITNPPLTTRYASFIWGITLSAMYSGSLASDLYAARATPVPSTTSSTFFVTTDQKDRLDTWRSSDTLVGGTYDDQGVHGSSQNVARYLLAQSGADYTCTRPQERAPDGVFCSLRSSWTALNCSSYLIVCTLQGMTCTSGTCTGTPVYQCSNPTNWVNLQMSCLQSLGQMQTLLALNSTNTGSATPNWSACRALAMGCSTGNDYFRCKYPNVAAASDNALPFCNHDTDFREIFVSCSGQCLHCMNQHALPNPAGTLCRPVGAETMDPVAPYNDFWSGNLYMNCLWTQSSSALETLYDKRELVGGASSAFTCLDAYMQNASIRLDPTTGAWVDASRRRLLGLAFDSPSPSSPTHTTTTVEKRYVGLAHHVLGQPRPRYDVSIDRLPTHRVASHTWTGLHPLHPLYETLPSIPFLAPEVWDALQPDHPNVLDASPSPSVFHTAGSLGFGPRPPHRVARPSGWTLHEAMEGAQLLHHMRHHGHPLWEWAIRRQPLEADTLLHSLFRHHQSQLMQARHTHHLPTFRQYRTWANSAAATVDGSSSAASSSKSKRSAKRTAATSLATYGTTQRTLQGLTKSWINITVNNITRLVYSYNLPTDPLATWYPPVCNNIKQNCNKDQFRCAYYNQYYVTGRKNRNTFCSNNLITSCQSPNQTYPLNYELQCSSGLRTVPHRIQCSYDTTDPIECMYRCYVSTPTFSMFVYPVPASTLLNAGLDSLYEARCEALRQIASDPAKRLAFSANYYWCVAPLLPVPLSPNNQSDPRIRYICYDNSQATRNYTLNCGMLDVTCYRTTPLSYPGTDVKYACVGKKVLVRIGNPPISDYITTVLRVDDVPIDVLVLGSAYNLQNSILSVMNQCVVLRDLGIAQAGTRPAYNAYQCDRDPAASYIRLYEDASTVCSIAFDATVVPVTGLLVPLLRCPNSGILINCTFHKFVDTTLNLLTGRFVCATDQDPRSTRNKLLTDNHQFSMACTDIDPLLLQNYGLTYSRNDGGLQPVSATDTRISVTSQDTCVFIKRNCATPHLDYFGCNTIFQQDTTNNEFCDIAPPPSAVEYPVFTCGTQPAHAIFCSNHDTAVNGWIRCRNTFPGTNWNVRVLGNLSEYRAAQMTQSLRVLNLDCSIGAEVMEAIHESWYAQNPLYNTTEYRDTDWIPKPELCNQIRLLCAFPVSTQPVVDVLAKLAGEGAILTYDATALGQRNRDAATTFGNAATFLSAAEFLFDPNDSPTPLNNSFVCDPPGLACNSLFCQVSNATLAYSDSGLDEPFGVSDTPHTPPPSNVSQSDTLGCIPLVPTYHLMCQGVPVTCELYTSTFFGLTTSSYQCHSTHTTLSEIHANADAAGIVQSNIAENGLACSVTSDSFTSTSAPSVLCQSIGSQCVSNNAVSCIGGFTATTEAPFCTLQTNDAPGNPMFECSDLAVTCEWNPIRRWMVCSHQSGSAVWEIGSQTGVSVTDDGGGCVIAPNQANLASSSNSVRFYENATTRCRLLDTYCDVRCKPGYTTSYDANGNPDFCEPDTYNQNPFQTFRCDGQTIVCDPYSSRSQSSSIPLSTAQATISTNNPSLPVLYATDPDYGRHNRRWMCHNVSAEVSRFPDSLDMRCQLTGVVLEYASDSCSAILGGCRLNGTFRCLGNYRSTAQHPFCTQQMTNLPASDACDCGLWWSNDLALGPRALETMATAPVDDACGSRGYVSTLAVLDHCWSQAHTYGPQRQCQLFQDAVYGAPDAGTPATQPWKQAWCWFSLDNPVGTCATQPGQHIPLCTVECPAYLTKTTLDASSSTEYCCVAVPNADNGDACSVEADPRNCVLGKHSEVWYAASSDTNVTVPIWIPPLEAPQMVQRHRSFYPNRECPRNLLWAYTTFPVTTTVTTTAASYNPTTTTTRPSSGTTTTKVAGQAYMAQRLQNGAKQWVGVRLASAFPQSATPLVTSTPSALQYTQARSLCAQEYQCWGFVVFLPTGGLYFLVRPPQLPPSVLAALHFRRLVERDTESIFHLHRVPESMTATRATEMDSSSHSVAYLIERHYGYTCDFDPTNDLNWRDYLDQSPEALQRVEDRILHHFLDAGFSPQFYLTHRYSDLGETLAGDALVMEPYQVCSQDTIDDTAPCSESILFNHTGAISFQLGVNHTGRTVWIHKDLVPAPLINEHVLKRAFFVNLAIEDMRDGVVLSYEEAVAVNQTIQEFADTATLRAAQSVQQRLDSERASSNTIQSDLQQGLTCEVTYNQPTTPAYTHLLTQKSNARLRRIPIWGKAIDGSTHSKVFVYNQPNPRENQRYGGGPSRSAAEDLPLDTTRFADTDYSLAPFVLVQSPYDSATLIAETQMVGWVDLPDDITFFAEFSEVWELYAYYAWRDWTLRGQATRGYQRVGPNSQCKPRTPLWMDAPYLSQDELFRASNPAALVAAQPLCVVPRCPLPISPQYTWPVPVPSSTVPLSQQARNMPDPDDSLVPKDWNSIPCAGQGICKSSPGALSQQGHCECYGGFQTTDSMDFPVYSPVLQAYHTPTALRNPSCSLDARATCFDAHTANAGSCANKGVCVTDFTGTTQTSKCKCGQFPANCNVEPRTCESQLLVWESNGFDDAFQCRAPREGCRNDSNTWNRPAGVYLRTFSYGCELPRTDRTGADPSLTGKCAPLTSTQWGCRCSDGHYGQFCQYVSLQDGCYDASDPLYQAQYRQASGNQHDTTCFWNPEIGQYQPEEWYDSLSELPSAWGPLLSLPHAPCRGSVCSGRGQCVHPWMDRPDKEVYDNRNPQQELNNLDAPGGSIAVSTAKRQFQEALRLRLVNQTCVCAPGYYGRQCQFRQCALTCLNGARCACFGLNGKEKACSLDSDTPHCVCPQVSVGNKLCVATSNPITCGGTVCGGHGNLTRQTNADASITWSCKCEPDWTTTSGTCKLCSTFVDRNKLIHSYLGTVPSNLLKKSSSSSSSSTGGRNASTGRSSSTGRSRSSSSSSSSSSTGAASPSSSSTGYYNSSLVLSSTGMENLLFTNTTIDEAPTLWSGRVIPITIAVVTTVVTLTVMFSQALLQWLAPLVAGG